MELSKNRLHHRRQKVRSVLIMKKRCCGLNRWWVVLLCSSFLAAHGTVRAAELYQNPVAAGDYPDPSVIRVGKDYWATATSSEWGPPFPILHSTDLVNWERLGVVFPRRRLACFFPLFRPGALPIELARGGFPDCLCWAPPSARPLQRTVD